MKFGPVPITKAEGAILAHSVRLGTGRLRKGVTLAADHIATLAAEGLAEVIVARLGPEDVHEDAAAEALAAALVPDEAKAGLDLRSVGTGRVNILSAGRGVVRLDAGAINAANSVDPMITVATVPPWQQMDAGGMVATVKIISYGVPRAAIDKACAAARGALSLMPPVLSRACLLQTVVPGDDGTKGHKAMYSRMDRLGIPLGDKQIVAHETEALCDAIRACDDPLILILTASATSDIDDVAPAAVRAAGGEIEHFGMPVDPGNLLFIGRVGPKFVIGLPGCARSPALNGADWVLARAACGVPVRSADIAAMGVGGLLKEIPSRPQPRHPRE